ncbi:unnamed protein product, partial [Effrenium voratum]
DGHALLWVSAGAASLLGQGDHGRGAGAPGGGLGEGGDRGPEAVGPQPGSFGPLQVQDRHQQ